MGNGLWRGEIVGISFLGSVDASASEKQRSEHMNSREGSSFVSPDFEDQTIPSSHACRLENPNMGRSLPPLYSEYRPNHEIDPTFDAGYSDSPRVRMQRFPERSLATDPYEVRERTPYLYPRKNVGRGGGTFFQNRGILGKARRFESK